MPIYLAKPHQDVVIKEITGSDKVKMHLKSLGFFVGESIILINKINDNVIVKVKGVSLAISDNLAKRILI